MLERWRAVDTGTADFQVVQALSLPNAATDGRQEGSKEESERVGPASWISNLVKEAE